MSSDWAVLGVHARCVGGPENGTLCDLEVRPGDRDALDALRARGGNSLSERYRLIERETTTGERILVYIGEPRES